MSDKSNEEIVALLKQIIGRPEELYRENIQKEKPDYSREEYINHIKSIYHSFSKKEVFQVGQLVQWKENLQNRILPEEGQPAIVLEILDDPIIQDNKEAGSPYFREPLDIVLGILDNKNRFLTLYYDSRRFQAYEQ